jgi:protein-S-isoprenylcysteine O-methyltransferase Ste14
MGPTEDPFIGACWAIFFIYWIVTAWWAKPTAERHGSWNRWWVFVIMAVIAGNDRLARRGVVLWEYSAAVGVVGDAVTVSGLVIALWARTILGGNWSPHVVLKERHELIQRGPYRYVRHPIYTGVLLMIGGMVILSGTLIGLIAFGISIAGISLKAWREERLLTKHFPDAYPRYRAHVKAMLAPFFI